MVLTLRWECPICHRSYIKKAWLHAHLTKYNSNDYKLIGNMILKQKRINEFFGETEKN